jgi:hypothetical protein
MPFYEIDALAEICDTTPDVVIEAAIVAGKKPMAGMLVFRPAIPLAFVDEIHRIADMHRRAEERRTKDSSRGVASEQLQHSPP